MVDFLPGELELYVHTRPYFERGILCFLRGRVETKVHNEGDWSMETSHSFHGSHGRQILLAWRRTTPLRSMSETSWGFLSKTAWQKRKLSSGLMLLQRDISSWELCSSTPRYHLKGTFRPSERVTKPGSPAHAHQPQAHSLASEDKHKSHSVPWPRPLMSPPAPHHSDIPCLHSALQPDLIPGLRICT